MATFEEAISSKDATKMVANRMTAELTLGALVRSISAIDTDEPNVRQFRRLEAKYLTELVIYERAHKLVMGFLVMTNTKLSACGEFLADIGRVAALIDSWVLLLILIMSSFRQRV